MATEIRVPTLGESVTEATIGQWFKKEGDRSLLMSRWWNWKPTRYRLKCHLRWLASCAIDAKEGETVEVGALLGTMARGRRRACKPGREDETGSRPRLLRPAAKPRRRPMPPRLLPAR